MEKQRVRSRTRELVFAAMLAAVTAVCSQIAVPLPAGVPVTLQTFAVALTGYLLGWRYGLLSVGAYLLLGLAGVPVFAQMMSGPAVLFGITGGFLIGFLPMAALCGFSLRFPAVWTRIALGLAGLAVCHLAGALQFSLLTGTGFIASLPLVSLPYLAKDAVSVVLACLFARMTLRFLPRA